jgi:hypothetical protein
VSARAKKDARIGGQVCAMLALRRSIIMSGHRLADGGEVSLLPKAVLSKGALPIQPRDVRPILEAGRRRCAPGSPSAVAVSTVLSAAKNRADLPLQLLFDLTQSTGPAGVVARYSGSEGGGAHGLAKLLWFTGAGWRVPVFKTVLYRLTISAEGKLNRNVCFLPSANSPLRPIPAAALVGGQRSTTDYLHGTRGEYLAPVIPVHDPSALGWGVKVFDGGVGVAACCTDSFLWNDDVQRAAHCSFHKPMPQEVSEALANLRCTSARAPELLRRLDHAARLGEVRAYRGSGGGVRVVALRSCCCAHPSAHPTLCSPPPPLQQYCDVLTHYYNSRRRNMQREWGRIKRQSVYEQILHAWAPKTTVGSATPHTHTPHTHPP